MTVVGIKWVAWCRPGLSHGKVRQGVHQGVEEGQGRISDEASAQSLAGVGAPTPGGRSQAPTGSPKVGGARGQAQVLLRRLEGAPASGRQRRAVARFLSESMPLLLDLLEAKR